MREGQVVWNIVATDFDWFNVVDVDGVCMEYEVNSLLANEAVPTLRLVKSSFKVLPLFQRQVVQKERSHFAQPNLERFSRSSSFSRRVLSLRTESAPRHSA
jgi:hypothetical protein